MFGHAIAELLRSGFEVSGDDLIRATRALRWLLDTRRDSSGLIFIVHPWEAGNDHAPRWDGWGVPGTTPDTYDQQARSQWNKDLMRDVIIGSDGAATGSGPVRGLPGRVQRLRRVQRSGAGHRDCRPGPAAGCRRAGRADR